MNGPFSCELGVPAACCLFGRCDESPEPWRMEAASSSSTGPDVKLDVRERCFAGLPGCCAVVPNEERLDMSLGDWDAMRGVASLSS